MMRFWLRRWDTGAGIMTGLIQLWLAVLEHQEVPEAAVEEVDGGGELKEETW